MDKCFETASELRFAQLACSNEDKDDACAKEEWMEWFAWEVSKIIDTFP